jgi:hypothetical protein
METKTSSGIATTSANPLLSIAKQIKKGDIIESYYPSKSLDSLRLMEKEKLSFSVA